MSVLHPRKKALVTSSRIRAASAEPRVWQSVFAGNSWSKRLIGKKTEARKRRQCVQSTQCLQ